MPEMVYLQPRPYLRGRYVHGVCVRVRVRVRVRVAHRILFRHGKGHSNRIMTTKL